MKERVITLGAGMLAIWLVFILLVPKPDLLEAKLSWPLSTDTGKQGLLGLYRWLRQADIPVMSLRSRYHRLADDDRLTDSGNLLIISLPQRIPAREYERRALRDWLNNGNSLLILAAIGDQPDWSQQSQIEDINSIPGVFDVSFAPVAEQILEDEDPMENKEMDSEPEERILLPNSNHPLLSGISTISVSYLDVLDKQWTLDNDCKCLVIQKLLRSDKNDTTEFWSLQLGAGHVWISRYADLFGNVSLGKGDNARLLANLVSMSLGDGGAVIFDDMHMGLSNLYNPDTFYRDPRLRNTIGFIVLFWLLYILGFSNRFGPIREHKKQRRMADFVRATGGLFARRVNKNEIARRLIGHFHNEVRSMLSLPTTGKPVWEVLEQRPKVNVRALSRLREIQKHAETGAKTDLVQLTHIIHHLRKTIR